MPNVPRRTRRIDQRAAADDKVVTAARWKSCRYPTAAMSSCVDACRRLRRSVRSRLQTGAAGVPTSNRTPRCLFLDQASHRVFRHAAVTKRRPSARAGPGDETIARSHRGCRRAAATRDRTSVRLRQGQSVVVIRNSLHPWSRPGLPPPRQATFIMRSVCCTTSLNTGAATMPPKYWPLLGSSIITATMTRGFSIGAMPVNQERYCLLA